jgi:hypothetical protein
MVFLKDHKSKLENFFKDKIWDHSEQISQCILKSYINIYVIMARKTRETEFLHV